MTIYETEIKATQSGKRSCGSNILLKATVKLGNERKLILTDFKGHELKLTIDDVIDVIFQAYRKDGAKNEK